MNSSVISARQLQLNHGFEESANDSTRFWAISVCERNNNLFSQLEFVPDDYVSRWSEDILGDWFSCYASFIASPSSVWDNINSIASHCLCIDFTIYLLIYQLINFSLLPKMSACSWNSNYYRNSVVWYQFSGWKN